MSDFASFLDSLRFGSHGLMPAIIQDFENGEVLMLGYMNREALSMTLAGPHVVFYSRSRQQLWKKGEMSGHTQTVKEIFFDCDEDALLIKVEQKIAACHNGFRSCFYRQYEDGAVKVVGKKIID
jgi:phosphoribosyl-AMP cyclohydrolase